MGKTLWQYYVDIATRITDSALEHIKTLDQWEKERDARKREFFISMALHPVPTRCDLKITLFGEFSGPGFRARKIAYQILPDCWSSGHFFLPEPLPEKQVPAVLYVCGHSGQGPQHNQAHAIMWARRGYACFIFDTIKQGENTGWHHGLYSGRRLDWISRMYTSAGGELLNSIRALDVLCSMPEVDKSRIGATGISGGGAHSHFLAAADERVKAVATSCGVTSLKSALKNRTVFQNCDCMFAFGAYQRDSCDIGALIAPRPLLYCFASGDNLFTTEEYRTLAEKVRKIYRLYDCEEKCELFEYPGPHAYSEASIDRINQWFDKYVAMEKHPAARPGKEEVPDEISSVFNGKPPIPNRLDILPELLTKTAARPLPRSAKEWEPIKNDTILSLRRNVFHWLDRNNEKFEIERIGTWDTLKRNFSRYKAVHDGMEIWMETWFLKTKSANTVIAVGDFGDDAPGMMKRIAEFLENDNIVLIEPRATGPHSPDTGAGRNALFRAASIVGVTPVLMWMNDLKQLIPFIRNLPECRDCRLFLYGRQEAGVACLYHAVFDEKITGLILENVPDTHADGGYIPGILKEIDITDASGLLAPRPFGVVSECISRWQAMLHWGVRVYQRLGVRDHYILGDTLAFVMSRVLRQET
jgi:dienelactone hydrolase